MSWHVATTSVLAIDNTFRSAFEPRSDLPSTFVLEAVDVLYLKRNGQSRCMEELKRAKRLPVIRLETRQPYHQGGGFDKEVG